MKIQYFKYFLIFTIFSCCFYFSCKEEQIYDESGTKPKQSDFIGKWASDYDVITVDITNSSFELIYFSIYFNMNITKWENVQCQMTFTKMVNGKEVFDEEFSASWRKGMTTYKITGTVISNNSPYNDLAKVGNTQSIYLNHSGYSSMYMGTTPKDASGSALFKKPK